MEFMWECEKIIDRDWTQDMQDWWTLQNVKRYVSWILLFQVPSEIYYYWCLIIFVMSPNIYASAHHASFIDNWACPRVYPPLRPQIIKNVGRKLRRYFYPHHNSDTRHRAKRPGAEEPREEPSETFPWPLQSFKRSLSEGSRTCHNHWEGPHKGLLLLKVRLLALSHSWI